MRRSSHDFRPLHEAARLRRAPRGRGGESDRPEIRRPAFEWLETRRLLSANLGQIAGVVFDDLGDSDPLNDIRIDGATASLIRDTDLDGDVDLLDTVVRTTLTEMDGGYSFDGLAAGLYAVQIEPSPTQQLSGNLMSAPIEITAIEAMGVAGLTIDDFLDGASLQATMQSGADSFFDDATIEGGERDVSINHASGVGGVAVDFAINSVLSFTSGPDDNGDIIITYDGDDDSVAVADNLLSLDLTQGGTNSAFTLTVAANRPDGVLILRAFTTADDFSVASITLDNVDNDGAIDGVGDEAISVLFNDFIVGGAGVGADFSNIAALQLELSFNGAVGTPISAQIDTLGVAGFATEAQDFSVTVVEAQSLTVTTAADVVDNQDFETSLREAIDFANTQPGADVITFDAGAFAMSQTMMLTGGQFAITDELTIEGPGQDLLTIDAQQNSRIFNIDDPTTDMENFPVTLRGMTLTGGRTTGDDVFFGDRMFSGGAIRSVTSGRLALENAIVRDNSTEGDNAEGGGILALGDVSLTDTVIDGNSTQGVGAFGGGVSARNIDLIGVAVSANIGASLGGGIYAENVTITDSAVIGNRTLADGGSGGGVFADGDITVVNSAVIGNSTLGQSANGAGLYQDADSGPNSLLISNSTVSNNQALGASSSGGGVFFIGADVTVENSTITANSATSDGGGVFADGDVGLPLSLADTIVAGNTSVAGAADLFVVSDPANTLAVNFSLIGDTTGSGVDAMTGAGNLLNVDPRLGPLQDNGGPIFTHAPLAGSPAIDAGDPNAVFDPTVFDQRGAPFPRITDGDRDLTGRLDIGAVEFLGLQNPSFEAGGGSALAWTLGGSGDTSTLQSDDRLNSYRLADDPQGFSVLHQGVPIRGGETLVIDTRVLVSSVDPIGAGNTAGLKVEFYDVFGGFFGTPAQLGETEITIVDVDSPTDEWIDGRIVVDAPSGAVEARVVLTFVGPDPGAAFFDSVSIRETIVVDSPSDAVDPGDGVTTLREAIDLANLTSGGDVIQFDPVVFATPQTITLTGGELGITDEVTIAGPGRDLLMIDAQLNSRVFNIDDPAVVDEDFAVSLSGMTITNGRTFLDNVGFPDSTNSGGAIRSASLGRLTIEASAITSSRTEGIDANGGGIFSVGDVALTDSTVSGNSTLGADADGAGIYTSSGEVSLTTSTVHGNTSSDYGGGVATRAGRVTLVGSTVSGNSSVANGGGVYSRYGEVSLSGSTVVRNSANGNGGGIYVSDTASDPAVTVRNSIIANNTTGGSSRDLVVDIGGALAFDFSVLSDTSGSNVDAMTGTGNLLAVDPMLGPLQDNGGPTLTHEPLAGSPVIDAGDPAVAFSTTEFDQRGDPFARVLDGDGDFVERLDIGAVEAPTVIGETPSLVVTTAVDVDDNLDFQTSLREAIDFANTTPGADTITFDPGVFAALQTMVLTGGQFEITDELTIEGPSQNLLVIDAQQNSRIFNIDDPGVTNESFAVSLSGLTLVNGRTSGSNAGFGDDAFSGGAIRSVTTGTLTIDSSTINNNATQGDYADGGAIFATGDVTITGGATVVGNSTTGQNADGGAIHSQAGQVAITNSVVSGNETTGDFSEGGGVYVGSGGLTLTRSSLNNNSTAGASAYGGGVGSSSGADVTLVDSTVSGNSATAQGGGVHTVGGDVTLTSSTVSGNTTTGATSHGGGIYAGVGPVTLNLSTVSGNTSGGAGGGIATALSQITLTGSTVFGNNSLADGGGVHVRDSASDPALRIENTIVAGNSAAGLGADLVPDPESALDIAFSLIGDTTDSGVDAMTGTGNLLDVGPLLGALQNNGGLTFTHAPLAGSPVIDAGDPAVAFSATEFDQRGDTFVRVLDGDGDSVARVDIGAVEAAALTPEPASLIVTTAADVVDNLDFVTSLREAIDFANTLAGADVITFDPTLSGETITLGGTELVVTDSLHIDAGSLVDNVVVDADLQSRVLSFTAAAGDLTLTGVGVTRGTVAGDGGGISFASSGALTLVDSSVTGNSTTLADTDGGGIFTFSGSVTLTNSTVSGNSSVDDGGGVATILGSVTLVGSTVSGNTSTEQGGGVYTESGAVTLSESTITGNASGSGGGLFVDDTAGDPMLSIENSIVALNTAVGVGPDLVHDPDGALSVAFSLIGDTAGSGVDAMTGTGNLLNADPLLGPLQDNGGPTLTHALLRGSPAIDAGDPAVAFDPAEFDQRGAVFPRVVDGDDDLVDRLDIGAVEAPADTINDAPAFDLRALNLIAQEDGGPADVARLPL